MPIDDLFWNSSDQFCSPDDVLASKVLCDFDPLDADNQTVAGEATVEASSILYLLSGRTIGGLRTDTVLAERMADCTCWKWGARKPCPASVVVLNTPVNAVNQVTIEGDIVDSSEYEVLDYRYLVRVRDANGDVRHWPRCPKQDTAGGDFVVSYVWGIPTPPFAEDAAVELSAEIFLNRMGRKNQIPGLQSVNVGSAGYAIRAQVNAKAVTDAAAGALPMTQRFMELVNPTGQASEMLVYSPDVTVGGHIIT